MRKDQVEKAADDILAYTLKVQREYAHLSVDRRAEMVDEHVKSYPEPLRSQAFGMFVKKAKKIQTQLLLDHLSQ